MVPFHFKQRSELKSDFYLVRTAAMMVSHDFAMRMVGNLIPQIPGSKEEVYDTTLESIVRKIGAHQVFMDISRCGKLTTLKFGCLQLCKSLSYLDVSYTKINDLRTISDNCVSLRGLNVAGTTLMDGNYSIVANLVSLEVLTLRNSNVNDVSWVHLLPMLRSLDLGILQVHTDPIAEIRNLTRLEELLLDCSTFPVCQEPSKLSTHLFEPFRHLPNLRLINLSETELSGHADNIRQCMTHHVYVEPMARRGLLFKAVAENNFHDVQRMVTSGFDIDCRATPADELMLAKLWRSRCTTSKLRAPYFMVSSVESKHRPSALHLAVLFNAFECVQILLDNGADPTLPVWFCDVREVEGKLIENNTLSAKQTQRIFGARQLVEAVLQRNVHRLTADLVTKKVANWKAVVTTWCKRLLYIFDAPRGSSCLSVAEIDRRVKALRVSGGASEIEEEASEFGSVSVSLDMAGRSGKSTKSKSGAAGGGLAPTEEVEDGAGSDSGGEGAQPTNESDNSGAAGGAAIQSATAINADGGYRRDKIIPPRNRLFDWRHHSMVEKLQSKPVIIEVSVPVVEKKELAPPVKIKPGRARDTIRAGMVSDKYKSTKIMDSVKNWTGDGTVQRNEIVSLPVLGARSHWLESRALVIQDRETAFEATQLPTIHKLDAVERAVAAAASLRPPPPVVPSEQADDAAADADNEESEDAINSSDNTPGFISNSFTPFMMSPPGTAGSTSSRATSSQMHMRGISSRDAHSVALPVVDEYGFRPDSAMLASTASMKRLSSSERRDRFLQQLSQRIEDRFNPDV